MRKSIMWIVIMLASVVLVRANALAEVPVSQGNADCAKWGGHMVWNWDNKGCPWCYTTCFKCWAPNYCVFIGCDLKACDETIIDRRVGKKPRIVFK